MLAANKENNKLAAQLILQENYDVTPIIAQGSMPLKSKFLKGDSIKTIILNKDYLIYENSDEIKKFFETLKDNRSIKKLHIESLCNLSEWQVECIAYFITNNENLESITINGNICSDKDKLILISSFKHSSNLKRLNLSNFSFQNEMSFLYEIQNTIMFCTNLQNLKLSNCKLNDAFAYQIFNSLKNNNSLSYLNLEGNQVTSSGISLLPSLISSNIKELYLDNNPLVSIAGTYLGLFLKNNSKLEVLSVENCKLYDEDCLLLSKGLAKNKTLKSLSISNNYLTDEGKNHIAKALLQRNLPIYNLSGINCNDELEKFINFQKEKLLFLQYVVSSFNINQIIDNINKIYGASYNILSTPQVFYIDFLKAREKNNNINPEKFKEILLDEIYNEIRFIIKNIKDLSKISNKNFYSLAAKFKENIKSYIEYFKSKNLPYPEQQAFTLKK